MNKCRWIALPLLGIMLAATGWIALGGSSPPGTVGGAWRAIHHAADDGDIDKVRRLLDRGTEINIQTKHGWTALHLAAKKNHIEVIKLLIERGADMNILGWGTTPMQDAAFAGHAQSAELLREAGANVDASSAAALGWIDELKVLLDAHPELLEPWERPKDRVEHCPCLLNYAASGGQIEVVKLLLQRGALHDQIYERRNTPLHDAAKHNRVEIIAMLIEAGHRVDPHIRSELTPLQLAAHQGNLEAARELLRHGADPGAVYGSRTAITIARKRGHEHIAQLLEQHAISP